MAVDLPFCFIAVRWLGTDRVGHWEHIIVDRFWKLVEIPFPDIRGTRGGSAEVEAVGEPIEAYGMAHSKSNEVGVVVDHGVEEAEKRNKSAEASEYIPRAELSQSTINRKCSGMSGLTSVGGRHLDAISVSIRHPQKLHLHPGALDSGVDTKSGAGTQGLGMEHWEEKAESGQKQQRPSIPIAGNVHHVF